jgi:hypothetical protein
MIRITFAKNTTLEGPRKINVQEKGIGAHHKAVIKQVATKKPHKK